MFNKIYDILTFEGTKELRLRTYTNDFELCLINVLAKVFVNKRIIGCFFHYTRALREKVLEMKLLSKDIKNISLNILHDLYKVPFIISNDKNYINSIYQKYLDKYERFKDYINYYKTQ